MGAELLKGRVELYRFREVNFTYTNHCVLVYSDDGDTVTIKGLSNKMTRADWRELSAHLHTTTVKRAVYHRHRKNGSITKEIKRK